MKMSLLKTALVLVCTVVLCRCASPNYISLYSSPVGSNDNYILCLENADTIMACILLPPNPYALQTDGLNLTYNKITVTIPPDLHGSYRYDFTDTDARLYKMSDSLVFVPPIAYWAKVNINRESGKIKAYKKVESCNVCARLTDVVAYFETASKAQLAYLRRCSVKDCRHDLMCLQLVQDKCGCLYVVPTCGYHYFIEKEFACPTRLMARVEPDAPIMRALTNNEADLAAVFFGKSGDCEQCERVLAYNDKVWRKEFATIKKFYDENMKNEKLTNVRVELFRSSRPYLPIEMSLWKEHWMTATHRPVHNCTVKGCKNNGTCFLLLKTKDDKLTYRYYYTVGCFYHAFAEAKLSVDKCYLVPWNEGMIIAQPPSNSRR